MFLEDPDNHPDGRGKVTLLVGAGRLREGAAWWGVALRAGAPSSSGCPSPAGPGGTYSTHLEEPLHVLQGRVLPQDGVGVAAHHVIDGLHDVEHFLLGQERGGSLLRASDLQRRRPRPAGDASVGGIFLSCALGNSSHTYGPSSPQWLRTSLVMQPSLLRSYKLKAQFSLSSVVPRRITDRPATKS